MVAGVRGMEPGDSQTGRAELTPSPPKDAKLPRRRYSSKEKQTFPSSIITTKSPMNMLEQEIIMGEKVKLCVCVIMQDRV